MDLNTPAHEIAGTVSAGTVSAEEVIERTLERMRQTEHLNIFISTNP